MTNIIKSFYRWCERKFPDESMLANQLLKQKDINKSIGWMDLFKRAWHMGRAKGKNHA
jgi:hypothetical protein